MNKHFYYLGPSGFMRAATMEDLKAAVATPLAPTPIPTTPAPTPPATPTPKAKFKPGDVVTLNSGSPDMTVVDETNCEVRVIYFPETDSGAYCEQPLHACFPAVCLSAIPTEAMN